LIIPVNGSYIERVTCASYPFVKFNECMEVRMSVLMELSCYDILFNFCYPFELI